MHSPFRLLAALTVLLSISSGTAFAQQSANTAAAPSVSVRKIASIPVTGDNTKELVVLAITVPPGAAAPMHQHPGDCIGSVVDGNVELLVQGQAARTIAAGQGYSNPRGVVHGFRNIGQTTAHLVNSFVVDKGVPLTQAAGG